MLQCLTFSCNNIDFLNSSQDNQAIYAVLHNWVQGVVELPRSLPSLHFKWKIIKWKLYYRKIYETRKSNTRHAVESSKSDRNHTPAVVMDLRFQISSFDHLPPRLFGKSPAVATQILSRERKADCYIKLSTIYFPDSLEMSLPGKERLLPEHFALLNSSNFPRGTLLQVWKGLRLGSYMVSVSRVRQVRLATLIWQKAKFHCPPHPLP